MSQNPDTRDYIVVLDNDYLQIICCKECGEQYIDKNNAKHGWCKPCQNVK